MKRLAALAVACAFLVGAAHAAARPTPRSLSDAVLGKGRVELVAQAAYSKAVLDRLTAPQARWKLALRHRSCWSHVPWSLRCDHARRQLLRHRRLLALAEARLVELAPVFPPHHALWTCIHSHEAADWHNRDTGGNGHYGGLQMHPGWGYGTSEYASDDSQLVQEWSAERGYRASGFSRVWLFGQWAHPDCMAFAG